MVQVGDTVKFKTLEEYNGWNEFTIWTGMKESMGKDHIVSKVINDEVFEVEDSDYRWYTIVIKEET